VILVKISEFLAKNEPKNEIPRGSKLIKTLVIFAIYALLLYTFGKVAYMVFIGARLTSKIVGF
jgi:hypothetical protein